MDEANNREKLVEAILKRPAQPTLEDAVAVIEFDSIRSVDRLLELDCELRRRWWERKDPALWWY